MTPIKAAQVLSQIHSSITMSQPELDTHFSL